MWQPYCNANNVHSRLDVVSVRCSKDLLLCFFIIHMVRYYSWKLFHMKLLQLSLNIPRFGFTEGIQLSIGASTIAGIEKCLMPINLMFPVPDSYYPVRTTVCRFRHPTFTVPGTKKLVIVTEKFRATPGSSHSVPTVAPLTVPTVPDALQDLIKADMKVSSFGVPSTWLPVPVGCYKCFRPIQIVSSTYDVVPAAHAFGYSNQFRINIFFNNICLSNILDAI